MLCLGSSHSAVWDYTSEDGKAKQHWNNPLGSIPTGLLPAIEIKRIKPKGFTAIKISTAAANQKLAMDCRRLFA